MLAAVLVTPQPAEETWSKSPNAKIGCSLAQLVVECRRSAKTALPAQSQRRRVPELHFLEIQSQTTTPDTSAHLEVNQEGGGQTSTSEAASP